MRKIPACHAFIFLTVASALALASVECLGQAPPQEEEFRSERLRMASKDLAARDITDSTVLAVMARVPRHLYVPGNLRPYAYRDGPLPIGEDQTISQPYIVAFMTQAMNLSPTDRVLEIGTGSGYQAAVLGEIAAEVYTIEIIPALAERSGAFAAGSGVLEHSRAHRGRVLRVAGEGAVRRHYRNRSAQPRTPGPGRPAGRRSPSRDAGRRCLPGVDPHHPARRFTHHRASPAGALRPDDGAGGSCRRFSTPLISKPPPESARFPSFARGVFRGGVADSVRR